jgi:hypothetical protein
MSKAKRGVVPCAFFYWQLALALIFSGARFMCRTGTFGAPVAFYACSRAIVEM